MAIFDPNLRSLIARVVYDGPAFSGKTTNVKHICDHFPVQQRSEVYTPGSLKGRTMFFDWLEITIGKLGGIPFRCQVLSVPGQRQRSYRRRPLIHSADTVVFVGDCRGDQIDETRRCFALMRRYLRERGEPAPVPVVVQANKQDVDGALPPDELARALRLSPGLFPVPAVASTGEGVRDTFNAAVRAAVTRTKHLVTEGGLGGLSGQIQSADVLLEALLELEDHVDDMAAEEEPTEDELDESST
jgi:signal recognition particle receptor subunit beta